LTSARHPCRFVADSGTALLRVQFRAGMNLATQTRGREADAFRDLRATGICASGFRSGARN
jgi:hypothetical protein